MKTKLVGKMVTAAAVLALLTGVAGYSAPATAAEYPALGPVRMTVNPGALSNLAEFAGARLGIFKKYGIDPVLINSASINVTFQLLQTNQLDFAATSVIPTVQASGVAGAKPMQLVAAINNASPAAVVCRKDTGIPAGYKDAMPQVKGKTFAMSSPSAINFFTFLVALKDFKIDQKDVKITFIAGNGPSLAAIQSRSVDCAYLNKPGPELLDSNYVTIMDFTKKGEFPASAERTGATMLAVLKSYADANPNIIKTMQMAVAEIVDYIGDPANASTVATAVADYYPGFDHAQLTSILEGVAPIYRSSSRITEEQFNSSLSLYNQMAPGLNLTPSSVQGEFKDWIYPQLPAPTSK